MADNVRTTSTAHEAIDSEQERILRTFGWKATLLGVRGENDQLQGDFFIDEKGVPHETQEEMEAANLEIAEQQEQQAEFIDTLIETYDETWGWESEQDNLQTYQADPYWDNQYSHQFNDIPPEYEFLGYDEFSGFAPFSEYSLLPEYDEYGNEILSLDFTDILDNYGMQDEWAIAEDQIPEEGASPESSELSLDLDSLNISESNFTSAPDSFASTGFLSASDSGITADPLNEAFNFAAQDTPKTTDASPDITGPDAEAANDPYYEQQAAPEYGLSLGMK